MFGITVALAGVRMSTLSACVRSTVLREFYPIGRRRAIVAHQAYLLDRVAVECGATFVVEWGNFPTT